MSSKSTSESKLKERLQRWGSQGRSGSAANSPVSSGSSDTDQDTQTTTSTRNNSPTSFDTQKVNAPSNDTFLYLGAVSRSKSSEENISMLLTNIPPARPVTPEMKQTTFGVFLQGSKDGFIALDCIGDWNEDKYLHHYQDASVPIITNSSVLAVRYNANQSQSMRDHKFQWYRSTVPVGTPKSSTSTNHDNDKFSQDSTYWKAIYGATRAVYQPSVTDCGYQLKCEITVEENSDDESEHHPTNRTSSLNECILCQGIELDPIILSEAQKYYHSPGNPASFDHLLGCGLAEGKIFRLVIEQGYAKYPSDMDTKRLASNVNIYQVSGNTEIALHDPYIPIFYVTAEADASRPNIFYLILPVDMPDSASGIQSLSLNRRLEFYAEDRFTREVCMTSLGVANFNGHPSNVSVKTPLFKVSDVPNDPPISTPARVSPTQRIVAIHSKPLFTGEVEKTALIISNTAALENTSDPLPQLTDRQPPSPHRSILSRSSSINTTQEAMELKLRIEKLEKSLQQKDCDLVLSEKIIENERKKCGELREALNAAEQRIE